MEIKGVFQVKVESKGIDLQQVSLVYKIIAFVRGQGVKAAYVWDIFTTASVVKNASFVRTFIVLCQSGKIEAESVER